MVCKNAETKSEKLVELKYEDLRGCNCGRCSPIADAKELDTLRSRVQDFEAKASAQERAKEIAAEIIATGRQVQTEMSAVVSEEVKRQLAESGVRLTPALQRAVSRKMEFDLDAPMANVKHGREQLSPAMKGFLHWCKTGEVVDRKALGEGTPSAGGYLVPDEFRAEIIRKLLPLTVVRRSGARVISMSRDSLDVPVNDDIGAGDWKGESAAFHEDDPTFANVNLAPKKYTRVVRASTELFEDSAINVADLLSTIFAEDFAAAEDKAFIDGNGTTQPLGINQAAIGTTAFTGAANIEDELTRLMYLLPRQYRARGGVFYARKEVIQKLANRRAATDERFLWGDLVQGEPQGLRFRGFPIFETDDLPFASGTPDTTTVLFGSPSYYYIADRRPLRVQRSAERWIELGEIGFIADMRVDGKVALTDAFKQMTAVEVELP